MTEYAGNGPQAAWDVIGDAIGSAQLSGIVGDSAHTYGYHRGRNYISSSDYSCQQSDDKQGPGEAAVGLDVTLNDADMITVSNRLNTAVNNGDDRLHCLREWYGTRDGYSVTGRDVRTGNYITSDDSHLWHVHLSFYRRWADDETECKKVAAVVTGGAADEGDDAMLDQYVFTGVKPINLVAGGWQTLNWNDTTDPGSSGTSAVISGRYYIATLDVTLDTLPPDGNVYLRYACVDKSSYAQQSASAISEQRGTGGTSSFTLTRAAYCPKSQYLRARLAATHPCRVTAATWSVLWQ